MRRGSSQRGATLIEAMIAVVVLVIATAAIAELLRHITRAQTTMSFQSAALDMYARLSAEIQDAHCDVDPAFATIDIDPALTAAGWVGAPPFGVAPPPGSTITSFGVFNEYSPRMNVRFQPQALTQSDGDGNASLDGPPTIVVLIEVRQITNEATQDDPTVTDGYWIRTYPVTKLCNIRLEPNNGRGEFYP